MKKTIILLAALCLLGALAAGFLLWNGDAASPSPAAEAVPQPTPLAVAPEATPAPAETAAPLPTEIDYDALYALHDPEEVVLRGQDGEMTWAEYFYLLYSQSRQVTDYFNAMSMYYGASESWADVVEGRDSTYARLTVDSTDEIAREVLAIESFARENQIQLTQAQLQEIQENHQQDLVNYCGEGATEEDFDAYLAGIHMTRGMYERMNRVNYLYRQGFLQLYGENGENYDDEAAAQYLRDNDYIAAHHILLMTSDQLSGESLSPEAAEEVLQTARSLAEELRGIEDPQERLARFGELKAEYCQDGGKSAYPDGYTFTPNTMMPAFEEAALGLEEYQVSDPVQTAYGYHVIMRLPLTADNLVYGETPRTARAVAANAEYGQRLQTALDGTELSFAPDFGTIDLLDYLLQPQDK